MKLDLLIISTLVALLAKTGALPSTDKSTSLDEKAGAEEINCDDMCFDYHRYCVAFHNETYASELIDKLDKLAVRLGKPGKVPKPSCDKKFFQERCRRSCKQCVPCNDEKIEQLYDRMESVEDQLKDLLTNSREITSPEVMNSQEDINECEQQANICGANTKCTNTAGGYQCQCEHPCEQQGEQTDHGTENCFWVVEGKREKDPCEYYACSNQNIKVKKIFECTVKQSAQDGKCQSVNISSTDANNLEDLEKKCGFTENSMNQEHPCQLPKCELEKIEVSTPTRTYAKWKKNPANAEIFLQFKDASGNKCEFVTSDDSKFDGGDDSVFEMKTLCSGDFTLKKNEKATEVFVKSTSNDAWTFTTLSGTITGIKSSLENNPDLIWYGAPDANCVEKNKCPVPIREKTYENIV